MRAEANFKNRYCTLCFQKHGFGTMLLAAHAHKTTYNTAVDH